MPIEQHVMDIVAEQSGIDVSQLSRDTPLSDIDLDSMAMVEIVFAFEERFDVQIPFNANDPDGAEFDTTTIATICNGLTSLIATKV